MFSAGAFNKKNFPEHKISGKKQPLCYSLIVNNWVPASEKNGIRRRSKLKSSILSANEIPLSCRERG